MNPRKIEFGSKEYKNLKAVAAMLEAVSPNNARYMVEDVYFDYGQNWMWTTIVRRGFADCQVLSPREWNEILTATNAQDLADCVYMIRNDKYFGDREDAR